jgi:hypothetical protein
MIPELNFANSELALVCEQEKCISLTHPGLNHILSTWLPLRFADKGCACYPGTSSGGDSGSLCFRPDGSDGYSCVVSEEGKVDICEKSWYWCASQVCEVPSGKNWGKCS